MPAVATMATVISVATGCVMIVVMLGMMVSGIRFTRVSLGGLMRMGMIHRIALSNAQRA
jgi:hypothetical protein